jgi:hypothetical protein
VRVHHVQRMWETMVLSLSRLSDLKVSDVGCNNFMLPFLTAGGRELNSGVLLRAKNQTYVL